MGRMGRRQSHSFFLAAPTPPTAAKKNGVGPGPSGPYGPRQDLPGKISQPRCPRPILINHIFWSILVCSIGMQRCWYAALVGDGGDSDGDGRISPEHPSPILHPPRDIISRRAQPSLRHTRLTTCLQDFQPAYKTFNSHTRNLTANSTSSQLTRLSTS